MQHLSYSDRPLRFFLYYIFLSSRFKNEAIFLRIVCKFHKLDDLEYVYDKIKPLYRDAGGQKCDVNYFFSLNISTEFFPWGEGVAFLPYLYRSPPLCSRDVDTYSEGQVDKTL